MHHHHHVEFRWVLLTALVALAVGIFLTMGYGLIGLAFLFLAGAPRAGSFASDGKAPGTVGSPGPFQHSALST